MIRYAIIELADGLTAVAVQPGQKPEDVAAREGGVLVETELYPTFEEANDAILDLQNDEEDQRV